MFNGKNIEKILSCSVFFVVALICFSGKAEAATNISATTTEHWAWNDIIGWIDFYNTSTTVVTSTKIEGYASSSVGDVSFDCATTRVGDICGQSNYGVTNDGAGNLSGWGWNDQYGWISFDCNNNNSCGSSNYRAYIDSGGIFRNYAWNDVAGWFSLNCSDPNICGTSNYKVVTSWLPTSTTATLESSTFDTGVSSGAQLNSVLWQGSLPAGTAVRFQFAVSNATSGPWTFSGSDGTSSSYYNPAAPNTSLKLDYGLYNNKRYFRYKTTMISNSSSTISPRIDDIIVNWSP